MSQPQALSHQELPAAFVEHAGLKLYSAFQPIISVVHSKVIGHEALIRGVSERNEPLSPAELFPQLVASLSAKEVSEACSKLHLESFRKIEADDWLFLNISPDSMPDRAGVVRQFGEWLAESGIPAHRVVVEIIETRAFDEILLAEAVAGFRDLGCLVAIDDFGAGESNFERIWRIRPDIVKLDRAMITEAASSPVVRRILPGIVSLVHEAGCLVVMEGIETKLQAVIAMESDTDFVQGFYFARPALGRTESKDVSMHFEDLNQEIRETKRQRQDMDRGFFASFTAGLEACVTAREDGLNFYDACSMFLAVAGVQRVYELDDHGNQSSANAEALDKSFADPRFSPCSDAEGANWFRRPYFQRAMSAPGKVQVSRPYLSIRDARSCVTMSVAFVFEGQTRVLCADLDYEQTEPPSHRAMRHSGIIRR